jgi:hypothetical protein
MTTTTVDELAKLLAGKFDISDSLLKELTNKAVGIANKKAEKTIKERFKEGGVFGLAKDFFTKNKPKEQDNKGILGSLKDLFEKNKPKEQDNKGILGSLKDLFEKNKPKEQDLIKEEQKPQKVLIDGITDTGYRDLAEKMPDILKGVFDKTKTKEYKEKTTADIGGGGLLSLLPKGITKLLGGALMAGGGIALLLGGVAALITGLNTDGPFKGLLKILSTAGIAGGLKLLEKGALNLIKNLKSFIEAPVKLFQTAYKGLRGIFGKGISKTITGALAKTPGLLTKMLGGLTKFITPLLKKLPLIGTVISLGFAYTRFKSGDVVGGIIDVLSGLASLVPGFGIPIAIGLDVLNAFLDAKAGGATGEASQKKAGMIKDFFGGIYDFIAEKLSSAFNWVVEIGKKVLTGNWGEAFIEVAKLVPGMGWVVDLMGGEEAVATAGNVMGGQALDFYKGIKNYVFEKINSAMGWIGEIGKKIYDGKWGEVFTDITKIVPGLYWVVNLMGGEEAVATAGNVMGGQAVDLMSSIKDKIMGVFEPIFGKWIEIGKKIGTDPGAAVVDIIRMIPGLGWMADLLGTDNLSSSINTAVEKAGSGDIFGSIAGLFTDISQTIKQKFLDNALALIPDTILGFPVRALIAQKLGLPIPPGTTIKAEGWMAERIAGAAGYDQKALENIKPPETSTSETQTASVTETPKPKEMAIGGVVTKPINAIVGEAGPEAVIPLDKYMSPEGFKISNDLLGTIANNTATTNETIMNLSRAILQLAGVFDKKQTNSNNIIVNGQNQPQQYPSAAQVAASNVDPIRQIRMQFAV